jgi:putative addiction module killer protein
MSVNEHFEPVFNAAMRPSGLFQQPVNKLWFDSLDPQAAAKVVAAKLRLTQGNTSSVKWFAALGEYVIDWGLGYRVYLAKDGETLIVLFGGGTKRHQQADIERAKLLLAEYKARKRAARRQESNIGISTASKRPRRIR